MSESQRASSAAAFQPSAEYLARRKRMDDAMQLRKPDRIPVAPLVVHFYPTKVRGISNKDAMYHPEKTYQAWTEAIIKHNWDAAPSGVASVMPARPLEILGLKQFRWPGGALADDLPFQWVEAEYMKQDEYDAMLTDPSGFAVRNLWPRISTALVPVSRMVERALPSLLSVSNAYTLSSFLAGVLSQPGVEELFRKGLELAEENRKNTRIAADYITGIMNRGFPIPWGSIALVAFDFISDMLRGLKGTSLDMYQVPDKLLAAIDMLTPQTISGAIASAERVHNKGIFIPMHRGAAGFMSEKQFARFYWPGFKALVLGLIDAGLTPIPLFEGDYTPRLEYLQELPAGKVVGHFDNVDRKKAKALIGDTMCFWGNVPASLMCTGIPQQVKDDVKELIDIFGDNGGLIIDSTMGLPDESKVENVQALTEAVFEYGVR
jgi:hypothetical protein